MCGAWGSKKKQIRGEHCRALLLFRCANTHNPIVSKRAPIANKSSRAKQKTPIVSRNSSKQLQVKRLAELSCKQETSNCKPKSRILIRTAWGFRPASESLDFHLGQQKSSLAKLSSSFCAYANNTSFLATPHNISQLVALFLVVQ